MTELDFIAERLLAIQAEQASIRAAMRAEIRKCGLISRMAKPC